MNFQLVSCVLYYLFLITNVRTQYANTTNECFYAEGKFISGTLITNIPISGNMLENLLATCCTMW